MFTKDKKKEKNRAVHASLGKRHSQIKNGGGIDPEAYKKKKKKKKKGAGGIKLREKDRSEEILKKKHAAPRGKGRELLEGGAGGAAGLGCC